MEDYNINTKFSIVDCCGIVLFYIAILLMYEVAVSSLLINDRTMLTYIYIFIRMLFFFLPVTLFYISKSRAEFNLSILKKEVITLIKTRNFICICCILSLVTLTPGLLYFTAPVEMAKKYAQEHINLFGSWPLISYVFLVVVIPAGEELIFRGILFNTIKKYNIILAYLLTSIIFYYYHGEIRSEWNFITSILFCWVYNKYETLTAPIILHTLYNIIFICNLLFAYYILAN
ncbi:MAG: type II CAAX endopeptidase family protein [Veillonellales bacterium]